MCWCGHEHPKWQRPRECPHCTCTLVMEAEILGTPIEKCAHCGAVLQVESGTHIFADPAWIASGAIH